MLYQIYITKGNNKINSHIKRSTHDDREIIYTKLNNLLEKLDFSTEDKKETQRKIWKNVFEKSLLSKREVQAVLGLLSKLEDRVNKS